MSRNALNQIIPFNKYRFDACMNYIAHKYEITLDQNDVAKLHLMIDFYHILFQGKPVIGGELSKWKYGPVVKQGYQRVKDLANKFDRAKTKTRQGKLSVIGKDKKRYLYTNYGFIDEQDLSNSEKEAIDKAYQCIIPKTFDERQEFFHNPKEFMGKVWTNAGKKNSPIDWEDILDAYQEQTGKDVTFAKTMINMWRE